MQVMEHDAAQRRAAAEELCGEDQALLKRLCRLLDATDRASGFLDRPAIEQGHASSFSGDASATDMGAGRMRGAAAAADPRSWPHLPDAVGTYVIVGVLGSGGMATVYEAIQEQPRRPVALKVMNRSLVETGAYERFRFETEVLARLQHPGIAQIYEAGAAQIGSTAPAPFFAMELVQHAVPITVYAQRSRLSVEAKLALFITVCDAVHYGHRHGVIHRDIKPGNVLVDGEGRAKVIDFGVARTTEAGGEAITATADPRQLIGTLNYMSPEQCSAGSDIDIRADVYSLGVLLYELLCEQLPHDLSALPLPAAIHTILHAPPRSFDIAADAIPRAMRRNVQAIVLKAIQKDPQRRYDSASALAADLRCVLNFEPVDARPPTVLEQCRLFARRNRGLVTTGSIALVSVVIAAIISISFAVRIAQEVSLRREAEAESIRERDLARRQAYAAQIAGALSAMKTGEFQQMRTRLAAAAYQPWNWEWGFLNRLSERSTLVIDAHDDMITDLAVNADWSRFVSIAMDGSAHLWDARSGQRIASWDGPAGSTGRTLRFSSDQRHVIVAGADGTVRLLHAEDLRETDVPVRLSASVRSAAELPGGRLAVAAADGRAVIVTLEPRSVSELPPDQTGSVHGLEVSPDGTLLATYNMDGDVVLRSTSDFIVLHRLRFPAAVYQVVFSRDGSLLAASGESGKLLVWRTSDGVMLRELDATGGVNTVRSIAFSADGTRLAAGLVHRGIIVVTVATGQIAGELGGHTEAVSALHFRPDDEVLVTSSWDRTIRTWRTSEISSPGGIVSLAGHADHVMSAVFSPDSAMLATASRDGTVRIWDPQLSMLLATIDVRSGAVRGVAFSPDGALFAAACDDHLVRVFCAVTGALRSELEGHEDWIACVAFDPSGTRVAAGANDRTARVWDLASARQELVLEGHRDRINSVAFSPDGAVVATGSRDRTVRLFDAQTGSLLSTPGQHKSDVFAVMFSPTGDVLYSGSRDQTVGVWHPRTGEARDMLDGHGQYVTSLSLNAGGTRLAAGSWYGEIVLFDLPTHDLIASFRAHDSAIRGVAFSACGRWLASGSYDGLVRLFDSATPDEADFAKAAASQAWEHAQSQVEQIVRADPRLRDHGTAPADRAAQILDALLKRGLDPANDPWLRKALLHRVYGTE